MKEQTIFINKDNHKGSMNFKYLFMALCVISLFSFVSASYGTQEKDSPLYYSFTSNNATACNISSANTPYGLVVLNQETDKDGQTFNTTIDSSVFSELGDYCFNIVCTDGENIETGNFCREVTPTGLFNSTGYYILILVLSLGIIILGLALRDPYITILGSVGLYFLGIYILRFGIVGVMDPVFTWATAIIVLGLAFYISIKSAYETIVD